MNAWRIGLWVGIVGLILWFLWMVRGVLPPFVLAFVIAVLLEPLVKRLRKRGMARPKAVFLALACFFGVLGVIALASAPYLSQQFTQAKTQVQDLYSRVTSTNSDEAMATIDKYLEANKQVLTNLHLPTTRQEIVTKYVEPNRAQIEKQSQSFVTGGVVSVFAVAGQMFMFFLTPLFVFGLLIDLENMRIGLLRFIPPSIRSGTLSMFNDIGDVFQQYLRGLATTVALYTGMMMLVLGLTGAPYFIVLALVAGLLYLIPVVGGIVSSVVVFLVVGLSGQTHGFLIHAENSWLFSLYVVGVMFVFGFAYDSVVNPRIVGQAVKLNPVVSAFVVFSAGALFGLPGMLCAYPVAGAVKVIMARLLKVTGSTQSAFSLPTVPLRHRRSLEA